MSFYQQLSAQLGLLTVPLLLCSLIAITLLIEKVVVLSLQSFRKAKVSDTLVAFDGSAKPPLVAKGLNLLSVHSAEPKSVREEIASIWLNAQRGKLSSGIRLLQVVALVTPLLGLLGTVLGLIQVFDDLGGHHGPIEPSLLADGLGLAMYTTAAGLLIALPALAGAHLLQIWVDKIIGTTEYAMNKVSLKIDGVTMGQCND
ncbi:outer membrane transport energization protein ExbB [Sinobacterium caligoides]|uniref:Outer membrane transport energization protein ExbB n=1 Tax=Sinobacterium caligoides TaxID=933926 RepID=A0A3N2DKP8_9GAMM|nr:MotA/TolQ/ExbB proton channel family protein [Sinobacterium caligoides]ROS00348.1 outer membrane transport energization protein ExbB [Sinobacterium caligoides]